MDKYEILEQIGKGSFGAVTKIKKKSDGKVLVWKEVQYGGMSDREKQQLVTEVNILRELKHPHIVRYYDRVIDKSAAKIYIVMEFCEGGDLSKLIKRCKSRSEYIAEDVIWKLFSQLIQALHFCHSRNGKILHRDIKPGNIFLDRNMNVKIGDFGLSKLMGEFSQYAYTHVGTPYYMSPEQISESRYNEQSDVWSAGCLLYEITCLNPPFRATSHAQLARKINKGEFDPIPARYSEALRKLIQNMLNTNYRNRPTMEQLLQIPVIDLRVKEQQAKEKLEHLRLQEEALNGRLKKGEKMKEILNNRESEISAREARQQRTAVFQEKTIPMNAANVQEVYGNIRKTWGKENLLNDRAQSALQKFRELKNLK